VNAGGDLQERIEAIESAYEFLLAYAAQGRIGSGGADDEARMFLASLESAIDGLDRGALTAVGKRGRGAGTEYVTFIDTLAQDAARALAAVRLARSSVRLSSELVDNLNASHHLRTLLTSLFLLESVLEAQEAGES
jgi:hypothetical protein